MIVNLVSDPEEGQGANIVQAIIDRLQEPISCNPNIVMVGSSSFCMPFEYVVVGILLYAAGRQIESSFSSLSSSDGVPFDKRGRNLMSLLKLAILSSTIAPCLGHLRRLKPFLEPRMIVLELAMILVLKDLKLSSELHRSVLISISEPA